MNITTKRKIATGVVIVLLFVTGCSTSNPPASTVTPQETLDTQALVETVVAQVETRTASEVADVSATVAAQVDAQLGQQEGGIDQEALAELVRAEVAAQLARQQEVVPTAYSEAVSDLLESTDLETALIDLYQVANPAVVYIIVPPATSGSGFLYDEAGHIITNNHVVAGGRSFEIVFSNGERSSASLVGSDADADLAVLQVDQVPAGVSPLPIAEPDSLQVGQFVVAIGNPFGEQGSMSLGIVSGLGRSLRSERGQGVGSYSLPDVVQTDAPINPGNSGGPLLNLEGQVVGVNSSIATATGVNSGVGFSIPAAALRAIVPSLIENGSHTYSYLGVSLDDEVSLSDREAFGLSQTQGAYVISIVPNGPADQAGLVAADPGTGRGGDLIVKLDDQPIKDFADLNAYLVFHTEPGQTIQVTVLRGGQEQVFPLTLGARP